MMVNFKTVLLFVGLSLIMSGTGVLAHTDVTAEHARELIDTTDDLIVVDVREPTEYCDTRGHIPGALNYPWNSGVLQTRYEELPIDDPILVVCRSGGRSNQAATFLDSQGFSMVYDMQGGMNAWIWETELCIEADEKYSGGTGEPNDPYQIATAEDLIALGETPEDYDKHFILTSDIDLDPNLPGGKIFDRAVIAPDVNDTDFYYEFQGIPFSGVFNGNGYTISHLTIEGISNLGLFGQLQEQGEVSNVGLAAVNVNGIYGIGAIVGDNFGGSIADSASNGSVNGNWFVGGLVGNNSVGSIINCCSTGMVTGKGDIGGLVGHNGYPERSNAVLANCYSTAIVSGVYRVGGLAGSNDKGSIATCFSAGAVTGIGDVGGLVGNNSVGSITDSYSNGNVSGDEVVGGLVGYNADSNITMSYSSGDVSGGDWTAGGLVGWNYNGSIAMSYSTGTVNGKWIIGGLVGYNAESSINTSYSSSEVIGHRYIGGLIGCNEDSNITMSYSNGVVTGNEDVGGLVGYNWLSSSGVGSTNFSFWDMESSGQTTSAGGEGKTTSEMQMAGTFIEAGWDFVGETENGTEDIWSICEGTNYPRFVWQIPACDFVCPDGITIEDFSFFMEHWLDDNCDSSNGYCDGTDLDQSGTVDVIDLEIFFENWPDKN